MARGIPRQFKGSLQWKVFRPGAAPGGLDRCRRETSAWPAQEIALGNVKYGPEVPFSRHRVLANVRPRAGAGDIHASS